MNMFFQRKKSHGLVTGMVIGALVSSVIGGGAYMATNKDVQKKMKRYSKNGMNMIKSMYSNMGF